MKKLVIPVAAALALSVAPAWADESETRVEQRTEQRTDGLTGETQRSRTVETKTDHDDDTETTVHRDSRLSAGGGTVEKKTEERVEHNDDD